MESFVQIPINTLLQRSERSLSSALDFQLLMKSRQSLQETVMASLLKLSRMNIYPLEVEGSLSEKSFGYLKNYHLYSYQDSLVYHHDFIENILIPIQTMKQMYETQFNQQNDLFKKSTKELNTAIDNLIKAKKNFTLSKDNFEKLKTKYISLEKDYLSTTATTNNNNEISKVPNKSILTRSSSATTESISSPNTIITITTTTTNNTTTNTNTTSSMLYQLASTTFSTNPQQEFEKMKEKCYDKYCLMMESHKAIAVKKKELIVAYSKHDEVVDKVNVLSI